MTRPPAATRPGARFAAITLVAAAAAQWVPSVVSLGQWLPVRHLPGRLCTWRGPDEARLALTFDDGPSPETTPAVLDRLDELGARATFFCLGSQARRWPDLVRQIGARGHQVETHGDAHVSHLLRPPGWVAADLDRALAAMGDAGVRPRWLRPPYGQTSGATLWAARRRGLGVVLWSAWGREWAAAGPDDVARRIVPSVRPGAVVLLHDGDASSPAGSAARASGALGTIAETAHRRGLRLVTLDEVLA